MTHEAGTERTVPGPVRAAGACVWRPTPAGDLEVLAVHRPKYDDWSLPKGKLDPGEHALVAAVREVQEETAQEVVLGRPLGVQRYLVDGRPKVVHYWAARADDTAPVWEGSSEVDEVRWVATWQAPGLLTRPRDADVVGALVAGPPGTVPLVVLRHADALPRKAWTRPDDQRPLSAMGEEGAVALVPLLATLGPVRVVSSDTVRCTATVVPFAAKAGLEIEPEHRVSEAGHLADPRGTATVVRALVAAGQSTILCTHRPVLPSLRGALEELSEDGVDVPYAPLRPADFLVLHHARGRIVAAEVHSLDAP